MNLVKPLLSLVLLAFLFLVSSSLAQPPNLVLILAVKPCVTHGQIAGDSDAPHELYQLETDPAESTDLAAQLPERLQSMRVAVEIWSREAEQDRTRTP